jgi:hypothetical protein
VVLKRLRAEGMEIREGALVERVSGGMHLVDVHISEGGVSSIVQGTHLLVARAASPTRPASTWMRPPSSTTSAASR